MAKTKLGELEQLWRKISGALKSAIDAHGPITELLITSTTKRIVGSINAPEEQAEIMHELAEIDELRHALDARDERIRELEQQRDDNIRRQNATLEECERNLYLQINDLEDKNESLEQQLKAAQERLALVGNALSVLVRRLHEVHADKRFESVWVINQLHAGPYSGPTYAEELKAADAALKEYFAKHSPSSGKERG